MNGFDLETLLPLSKTAVFKLQGGLDILQGAVSDSQTHG